MKICLFLFVLVLLVALAPQVTQAQCQLFDPLSPSCMQQDTYNIIHDARRQHEANLAISQIERLVFRGGYYGYDNGGTFVPMYDRYRRPIGRREATITGAGIGASIGTGIGSLKNRPGAGALLGAGGGALLGLVLSGRGGEDKPVDCSKKLNRKERETCSAIAAEQQAAILQQQIAIQQDEAQRLAQTYYNRTGRPVDIRDVIGNLVADIPNGGSVDLPESSGGYKAYMRFPAALGKTAFRPADQRLAKDGSGFVLIFPVGGGV